MKTKLHYVIFLVFVLFQAQPGIAQAPDLGTAAGFVLFSATGAVGNTGISQLIGNVGTNGGAITGFGNVNGVMHNADGATAQAAIDLQVAWQYLANLHPTTIVGPVLGNGEVLFAGVDTIIAAGSIAGLLTLDAQGDSNAVFVIKIGGALTSAASATVNLVNGALACNVFWITKGGAISLATLTTMRGTLIANPGAIDMGAGCTFEGRAFSTTGAVTIYGTSAFMPLGCSSPILNGPAVPVLNSVRCFALFSSSGALVNTGTTNIEGDIGTNNGFVSGYDPFRVAGIVHATPDASTTQCETDLQVLYIYLSTLAYDIELLYPAQFGNKLTLTPHVYRMNAAAVLTDTLYLDAAGNANAIFVIQIDGALTTATHAKVALVNGAKAMNVYWMVEGAVMINNFAIFCGTIVAHNVDITLNADASLSGRALTTLGNINTTTINVDNAFGGGCTLLPLKLSSFTGTCEKGKSVISWTEATITPINYFAVERSADGVNWVSAGIVKGSDNTIVVNSYSFTEVQSDQPISYYRLSQTDLNGNSTYGSTIAIPKCSAEITAQLLAYPNPSSGKFSLNYTGDAAGVYATEIFNALGEKVYETNGFQAEFDLSRHTSGIYFLVFKTKTKTIKLRFVLER